MNARAGAVAFEERRNREVWRCSLRGCVVDLHRTRVFAEKNLLLSTFDNPFKDEESLVFATPLSDPAGRAAAIFGVSRKCLRWGMLTENNPCWFVIDREGIIVYKAHPKFESRDSYITDVDGMLEALRKATRTTKVSE
ncbi:MAG: hypothetical protein P1U89_04460 [Verrucomicrobiales bacterium]|nr:hypothetical protein [Verrucomicrobiales bacterium]